MIYVVDDEWAAKSLSGIVVHEGLPRAGLDLRLERGCVIRGRVTAGPTSLPAPGLTVLLVEQGPLVPKRALKDQPDDLRDVFLRVADTDQDGRYAFRVAAGSFELTGPRQEGAESVPETLNVGNEREIERNFRLARAVRPWRTLRGVVRAREHGGPTIADAIVVAEPIGIRSEGSKGSADEKGRFELHRPFARAFVYARNPKGDLAGYATRAEDDDTELTIVAEPAASAHGQVVDSSGKPPRECSSPMHFCSSSRVSTVP